MNDLKEISADEQLKVRNIDFLRSIDVVALGSWVEDR